MGLLDGFEDDMECPLCLEEMDISDLNFKPCPCGYQICRFCWHHIKENVNNRCPACRKPYEDSAVEFKAIKPEELKRLQAAKKLRDKKRKDEASVPLASKADVRVRQRAQVHIQGMTAKTAHEDNIPYLRSSSMFGQFGKILKLSLAKRTVPAPPPNPLNHPVHVYINYRTPQEAISCIQVFDGTVNAEGQRLKATFGTTRYCQNYLRGARCQNENCVLAHEPGEEIDGSATREEMLTYSLNGTGVDKGVKPGFPNGARGRVADNMLPATASWASKNPSTAATPPPPSLPPASSQIPPKPQPIVAATTSTTTSSSTRAGSISISLTKPANHPLPARPASRSKTDAASPSKSRTASREPPATKATSMDVSSAYDDEEPVASTSAAAVVPPVLAELSLNEGMGSASWNPPEVVSFPDLDFGQGTFHFSLDLNEKGKGKDVEDSDQQLNGLEDLPSILPRVGSGVGLSSPLSPSLSGGIAPSYLGSFDPFAEGGNGPSSNLAHDPFGMESSSASSTPPPGGEGEAGRRSSRFGFARRGSQSLSGVNGLASGLARSAFASPDMESSTSFLGFGGGGRSTSPGTARPPSSVGFSPLPPPSGADLWAGMPNLASSVSSNSSTPLPPPAIIKAFAAPTDSGTSSPQLSPRSRANLSLTGGVPSRNGGGGSSSPSPSRNQQGHMSVPSFAMGAPTRGPPIAAAAFPLPPPDLKANPVQSTPLGKDDLLALIAAAQSQAPLPPKTVPTSSAGGQDPHTFTDPAILNARFSSGMQPYGDNGPHPGQHQHMHSHQQLPPSAAYHSLDSLPRGPQQFQQPPSSFPGFGGHQQYMPNPFGMNGFPPQGMHPGLGMRSPPQMASPFAGPIYRQGKAL